MSIASPNQSVYPSLTTFGVGIGYIVMAAGKFISYLRVSTDRQGKSGLGLEAQKAAVLDFLNGGPWALVGEFTEIESGGNCDRPQLAKAIAWCRLKGATLLVAKLDRLARDAHFLLGLQKAGIEFVAADMPHANRLTVGIMAVVAEEERRMISARTRSALAAAKARGVRLGGYRGGPVPDHKAGSAALSAKADAFAQSVMPVIRELRAEGITSLRGIAGALTERGVKTARGSSTWTANAVLNVLRRVGD